MATAVPQTTKLDPTFIPINGCTPATDIDIKLAKCSSQFLSAATISDAEAIVFFASQDQSEDATEQSWIPIAMETIDKQLTDGFVTNYLIGHEYKPTIGNGKIIPFASKSTAKYIGVIGMGKMKDIVAKQSIKIAKALFSMMKEQKPSKIELVFPKTVPLRYIQAIMESFFTMAKPITSYTGDESKKKAPFTLSSITIVHDPVNAAGFEKMVQNAKGVAQGVYLAQELVTAPPNYCNTISFANTAVQVAEEYGFTYKIYDVKECEANGMGGILAVGKGSMFPPRMIHLTYKSSGTIKKKFAFVGKGIQFDSGGYNIKSAASMIDVMKFDMGGAAAVMGTAKAVGVMKPEGVEVHFIMAAAENMVSSAAYRPGDVITISNGKTVEINNTDAEGRMVLSDALVLAEKLNVDYIVDFATLTGACMVALGLKIAGAYSNNDSALSEFLESAKTCGEMMAGMPLEEEYKSIVESKTADLTNAPASSRNGGSILAALFLSNFIEKTPWIHVDMAGPVWDYDTMTGTGYGVKTAYEFISTYATQ